jgi:hypothetical protein
MQEPALLRNPEALSSFRKRPDTFSIGNLPKTAADNFDLGHKIALCRHVIDSIFV